MSYISGNTIKNLREGKALTQKMLAERLSVSDKTVSKWETDRGLPDITILPELARSLGVSVAELMTGDVAKNANRSANLLKTAFYVCPVCGNVIESIGTGSFSCCGILLPPLEAEEDGGALRVSDADGELFVELDHEMTRAHYISFFAYVTTDAVTLQKLYPEQDAQCRFTRRGPGLLYAYCNRHGLMKRKI